jgi:hypothetical protein
MPQDALDDLRVVDRRPSGAALQRVLLDVSTIM